MNHEELIEVGLSGPAPLKIIMRGSVLNNRDEKVGVVSIVYVTMDKIQAKNKIHELVTGNTRPQDYYMVYSVPVDTDLTKLDHFPSIAITPSDLA